MKTIFALVAAIVTIGFTAPGAQAQDYRLQSGDTIRVEVLEDEGLNRDALVRPDGYISIPYAGSVRAGGRTVEEVQSEVQALLAPNFASNPNVFVTLSARRASTGSGSPRTFPVYVMGEVNSPGAVDARSGTTLLQLLAQTGGFTRFAATKRVQLRRADKSGAEQVYTFNYDAIMSGASKAGTTRLAPGDVIVIPQRMLFE